MARGFGATLGVSTSDKVTTAAFTPAAVCSWAGWYRRNGSGGGSAGRIFDTSSGTNGPLFLWINATTRISYQRPFNGGTGAWEFNAGPAIAAGAWVHFVICHDANSTTNNPAIYINGVLTTPTSTTAPIGSVFLTSQGTTFGNRGTNDRVWDGALGDMAVWNGTLLSAAEAHALYDGEDPRNIRRRYLVERISMRDAKPVSLIRASQPATNGTRFRADGGPPLPSESLGWLANALAVSVERVRFWIIG